MSVYICTCPVADDVRFYFSLLSFFAKGPTETQVCSIGFFSYKADRLFFPHRSHMSQPVPFLRLRVFWEREALLCYWFSRCWIATLNGVLLPFESCVRIKRTVKLNRSAGKVKHHSVTWPLLCPCSQTNLALWGIFHRRFVSIEFLSFFVKLFFCAWLFLWEEWAFFVLACADVDGVALDREHWPHCVQ